jgi:hypothetical protein
MKQIQRRKARQESRSQSCGCLILKFAKSADCGLFSADLAAGTRRVKSVKRDIGRSLTWASRAFTSGRCRFPSGASEIN